MAVEQGVDGLAALPAGLELSAALESLDLSAVTNVESADVLQASWRQVSHAYAFHLAAMAEVAGRKAVEEASDVTRLPGNSEWAGSEVGAALTFTDRHAYREVEFATMLVSRMPLVHAALAAGSVDHHKARVFADYLAGLDDAQIAAICERLVPPAAGWTVRQLAIRLLAAVQAIDPTFTRRQFRKGVRERGVFWHLNADGTATCRARGLTPSEAGAASERLNDLADAIRAAGHPGEIGHIRADLLVRLLDGSLHRLSREQIIDILLADATPGVAATPAAPRYGVEVRVGLGTLLGVVDEPGELPGLGPIVADDARLVVARQRTAEWCFAVTDDDGTLLHTGITRRRPEGAASASRGGVVELRVTAGQLASLAARNDLPTGWAAIVADIAAQYAARTPDDLDRFPRSRFAGRRLRRYVQIRDRTCIAPGCDRPARRSHLDHTLDHGLGGETVRGNLAPLCHRHHAMKHKGGWRLSQPEPGSFRWKSPLWRIYWTRGSPTGPDLPRQREGPGLDLDDLPF